MSVTVWLRRWKDKLKRAEDVEGVDDNSGDDGCRGSQCCGSGRGGRCVVFVVDYDGGGRQVWDVIRGCCGGGLSGCGGNV